MCLVEGCEKTAVAGGLCEMHYKRLRRHGHLKTTRPDDWGKKEKHPLCHSWRWHRKIINGLVPEWKEDFWAFVKAVGDKPSSRHVLRKLHKGAPLGPSNFEWYLLTEDSRENKEYQRQYRKKYPEKAKNSDLRKKFGISLFDYNNMLASQGNVCAVCKTSSCVTKQALAVDHCHKTGKIRGLLCANCNKVLGHAKDSIEVLKSAISYLGRADSS